MNIEQTRWTKTSGWEPQPQHLLGDRVQLALIFGGKPLTEQPALLDEIKRAYPAAKLLGCSTAGEIFDTQVSDDALVVTAIEFNETKVLGFEVQLTAVESSYQAGLRLAEQLSKQDLVHVFVLSDGLHVNGSQLVAGLVENLPPHVTLTGGLAGDGDRFSATFVLWNDVPKIDTVAVVGLYGKHLRVRYGSLGGWDSFGPERLITKSKGNILYELDGRNALDLYKKYLGEHADELPASGLLYPLSLRTKDNTTPVVRTILAVDETEKSMTFAGDVPEGAYARLMKANFDRLIDGAISAAKVTGAMLATAPAELAILISCVGRKLVLKQRVEEEVEGVRDVLGEQTVLAGFYSYGEISPFTPNAKCELHNQTMTITTLSEDRNYA
jgi:hypothetical protein